MGVKLLIVEFDRKIFEEGTESRVRAEKYSFLAEEVHFIVYSLKKKHKLKDLKIKNNVWLHPTNSKTKFRYIFDAIKIGRNIKGLSLVVSQDPWECALTAFPVAKIHKAKLQIQIHTDPYNKYFLKQSLGNRYLRPLLASFFLPKADSILFVSKRSKESVESQRIKLPKKKYILPMYVNKDFFSIEVKKAKHKFFEIKKHIIYSGSRIVKEKDFYTTIKAFREVKKKRDDVGLLIVGEGYFENKIKNYVNFLHLENDVLFLPWQKDPRPFLAVSEIFLITSLYEGHNRAIIEAIFSGKPIITTRQGVVEDILLNNVHVLSCESKDYRCISKKILFLLENPEKGIVLNKNAKKKLNLVLPRNYDEYLIKYKKILEDF
jgi:glycosyltransferase involved in cell wall biosynthesis